MMARRRRAQSTRRRGRQRQFFIGDDADEDDCNTEPDHHEHVPNIFTPSPEGPEKGGSGGKAAMAPTSKVDPEKGGSGASSSNTFGDVHTVLPLREGWGYEEAPVECWKFPNTPWA